MAREYSANGFNLPQVDINSEQRAAQVNNQKGMYNYEPTFAAVGVRTLKGGTINGVYSHDKSIGSVNWANFWAMTNINNTVNNANSNARTWTRSAEMIDAENRFAEDPSQDNLDVINSLNPLTMDDSSAVAHSVNDYLPLTNNGSWIGSVRETGSEIFDDYTFGRMCVAGAAPLLIEIVTGNTLDILTDNGFTDSLASDHPEFVGETLDSLLSQNRLFMEDFKALKDILPEGELEAQLGIMHSEYDPESTNSEHRYIFAPVVLYALTNTPVRDDARLLPIGIQCRQLDCDGPDPVVHPNIANAVTADEHFNGTDSNSDYQWQMAKTIVLNAQNIWHETFAHLGGTHLVSEAFTLACRRSFYNHPILALMGRHFQGTINLNYTGVPTLLPKNSVGWVSEIYGCSRKAFLQYTAKSIRDFSLRDLAIPDSIARRGVDSDVLPFYPYRDDALVMWGSIHGYVKSFIDFYYAGENEPESIIDSELLLDYELSNFIRELCLDQAIVNEEDGSTTILPGLNIGINIPSDFDYDPENQDSVNEFNALLADGLNKEWLYDLVTLFVFTATSGHASYDDFWCMRF